MSQVIGQVWREVVGCRNCAGYAGATLHSPPEKWAQIHNAVNTIPADALVT